MYLSWIIPAYNEEKRISRTLDEVEAYLKSKNFPDGYEIIVVDSSSQDRTAETVKNLQSQISNLLLLVVENRGKGWAVMQGMLKAQGEIRLFSDADNSTAPEYFDAMTQYFNQGFGVVISSRDPRDAEGAWREQGEEPWFRRALTVLGNLIIQIFGVWGIWDTQNGFKALTAKAAEDIFSRSRIDGFAFDVELLALARRLGYRIAVIPIRWRLDPESKVTFGSALKVFFDVFRVRWYLMTGKYEIRISKSETDH